MPDPDLGTIIPVEQKTRLFSNAELPIGELEIYTRRQIQAAPDDLEMRLTQIKRDLANSMLARRVEKALREIDKPLRIAVMGCVVNGPGEAADADLAICAAKDKGYVYRRGRKIAVVPEDRIIRAMLEELKRM